MLKLARFLKKFRLQVIMGPVFKLTEAIFELIVPLVMASIIDVGVKNNDLTYVLKMGGLLVLIGIIGLACSLTCQRFAALASQGFGTVLRNELFHHINTLSHAEIDVLGTPSLVTRMTNDINQLQLAVAMLIRLVIRAPFLAIGAVVMAISIDAKLSLIFILATLIIGIVIFIVMNSSIPFYRTIQKKLDKISLITRENLVGARVIRAFSGEEREYKRFNQANDEYTQTAIKVSKISSLLNPLTYIIVNFAIIAILWFGGMRVDNGSLTQGQIIALVNYMMQTLHALIVVANLVIIFTKASASASRVNEVLDTNSSIIESLNTIYANSTPKIKFSGVCFSYEGTNENAIENISFEINQCETVGIIGATGSGKSTIVSLISRFYDITNGSVEIDGINVKEYKLRDLRKKIGVVPQKAVLFSGTIADNIRWGNAVATESEIWEALKIAQAYDFVNEKPDKLNTIVTQGGKNLSGGQKQRLTIARAIISKPEILILDDSSSALDFVTDAALRKSLRNYNHDYTQIIVSQRISTIKNADKIIVLDDGKLAGIGTHENLIKMCSVYNEIFISQVKSDEVNN